MSEIEFPPLDPEAAFLVPTYSNSSVIRWCARSATSKSTSVADSIAEAHDGLPIAEDISAAFKLPQQFISGEVLTPGDSRTLLIMTRMLLYETGQSDREIELTPMQISRKVEDDPDIKDMSLLDMMQLSGGTTQWASSGILLQDRDADEIKHLLKTVDESKRYMLEMSWNVKMQWIANRASGKPFTPELLLPEVTIQRQARHAFAARRSKERIRLFHVTPRMRSTHCVVAI